MRAGCVIALACLLPLAAAAAEQEFPYSAYVARDEMAVRAGPGRNYYVTEKLPLGEAVEVYRHENGWCAIRPPADSFSWVRADDLRIGRNGIGIVLGDGASSRIGSNTSGLRDVIQVRLERGEEVEVLDAVQVSNDNGVEFYCKIAPPSGEFRWVHKDDISREEPAVGPSDSDEPGPARRRRTDAPEETTDDERRSPAGHWGSWVRSRRGAAQHAGGESSEDQPSPWEAQTGRSIALAGASDADTDGTRAARDRSPGRTRQMTQEADIQSINRELSRIIVEEPARWDFQSVRQRLDAAMDQAADDEVRDEIRDMRARIERFEDIQKRSLAIAGQDAKVERMDDAGQKDESLHVGESLRSKIHRGEDSHSHLGETRPHEYDGVGKLTRVVSRRPGAPRYALVNNANEVVAFVSPGSGINLQSFEGQYVGISGGRGYMPELRKPHVTALRVNALSDRPSSFARRSSSGVR